MAIPSWTRTWTNDVWTGGNRGTDEDDNRDCIIGFKDLLKTAGWTVIGSSDGTSYAFDGTDYWTDYTDNIANTWIVLQTTDLGSAGQFQICIAMGGSLTSPHDSLIYVSAGGLFNDTGIDATTRPTASDEFALQGSNLLGLNTLAGTRRVDIWYANEGYRIVAHNHLDDSTDTMILFEKAGDVRAEWTDNWICAQLTPDNINLSIATNSVFYANLSGSISQLRLLADGNTNSWLTEQTHYGSTNLDGEWVYQKALYFMSVDSNRRGIWGKPIDMYFAHTNLLSGTELPSTGPSTAISYIGMILPWDDSAPWAGGL